MAKEIDRETVQALMREGAQLLEVLSASSYDRAHPVGARSLPLATLDRDALRQVDCTRPAIVYCHDQQ